MRLILRATAVVAVIAIAVFAGFQFASLTPDVGGPLPSPSEAGTPSSSATPAADCINPPIDITSLIDVADPVACYGNTLLTLDAERIAGVADCPVTVEPVWLSCPQNFLRLVGETRKLSAPMLTVAVDPVSGASMGDPNTNVRLTGHFDDAAAQTCRVTEPLPGESPEAGAVTIENCRRIFVVTQAVPLEPSADATGTIALISGGVVDGPGLSVSEAMAGAPTEQVLVNGWLLIDGFGNIWLCETLVESNPPRFDGARLRVENYSDAPSTEFREADGVRWIPDSIQLFGNVSVP